MRLDPGVAAGAAGALFLVGAGLLGAVQAVLREEISPALAAGLVGALASLPALLADIAWARGPAAPGAWVPFVTGPLLLMGVGWPAAALLQAATQGRAGIRIRLGNWVEVLTLLLIVVHGFFLAFKGTVTLWDTGLLAVAFLFYLALGAQLAPVEDARKEWLLGLKNLEFPINVAATATLLVLATGAILFGEYLVPAGLAARGPWSAAALRELPVLLTTALMTVRGRAQPGLRALIAAQVVQGTLGLCAIPLAALLTRGLLFQPLSPEQVSAVALYAALTFFGLLSLSGLTLRPSEAAALGIFTALAAILGDVLGFYQLGAFVMAGCALLVVRRRSETGKVTLGGG